MNERTSGLLEDKKHVLDGQEILGEILPQIFHRSNWDCPALSLTINTIKCKSLRGIRFSGCTQIALSYKLFNNRPKGGRGNDDVVI